ncbi:hypothetical protein [Bradyrhizobium algeriense]|uniref:hypothetical protein n=1 Tax=Bradyrhizobium algeriense TaxID=634784 RepID=UPI001930F591|nr:hypothetical protein [Bradyrhizobium algeriense]
MAFDHTRADLRRHQFRVDWAFELPDGSRFTDPRWHRWLEDARTFLWSLRVDPPVGRRQAQARSLVTVAVQLRFLIRWMAGRGMHGFDELDTDAAKEFMRSVTERRGMQACRSDRAPVRHTPIY